MVVATTRTTRTGKPSRRKPMDRIPRTYSPRWPGTPPMSVLAALPEQCSGLGCQSTSGRSERSNAGAPGAMLWSFGLRPRSDTDWGVFHPAASP